MCLSDWLDYIRSIHVSSIDLGLDRVQAIAKKLNLIHFNCPVITIAGTNGKGSTVAALEQLLRSISAKVAAYTSPHLIKFNERLRIDGQDVDDESLVNAFAAVEQARDDISLSFFEFTLLACLVVCRQTELDYLILEVGLGGRLDAVNVVEPDIAIITHIAMDHQDWLGDTLEKIGYEKAGIMRAYKPAIYGDAKPISSVVEQAQLKHATLLLAGRDFKVQKNTDSWDFISEQGSLTGIPYSGLQPENIACALEAYQLLKLPLLRCHVDTLSRLVVLGRQTEIFKPVHAILDVAHNPDSAQALARRLGKVIPAKAGIQGSNKVIAVCAMLEDKDHEETLKPLLPYVDQWLFADVDPELPRAGTAAELQAVLQRLDLQVFRRSDQFSSVCEALNAAQERIGANDLMIIFGSFHAVAQAVNLLQ